MLQISPPVIAHRGASAYAPENTLAAFRKAKMLGINWIEFDVGLAACGELIIFHDELLERTTNGKGIILEYPYSYLRKLDAGSWFHTDFANERIPTLKEALIFLQQEKMHANIEIKTIPGHEEKQARKVLEMTEPFMGKDSIFLFSSFSIETLQHLRRMTNQYLGLLLHEWLPNWEEICTSLNPVSVHVNESIMTAQHAKKIKQKEKLLLCYTVNDPKRAKTLFGYGVDAVFSDIPDKIIKR